jgi:hypothetical protein
MLAIKISTIFPDYEGRLARWAMLAAQKIRRRMRERMDEAKHGRVYARRRGGGFQRFHRASARGESPARDTGAYDRSLNVVRRGTLGAAIETVLGYPLILESIKGLNRPLVRPAVEDTLPELATDLERMLNA